VVCLVTCTDGSVYTIYSCVKGRLVEVNTRLLDNPSLLVSKVGDYFASSFYNLAL